MAKLPYDYDVIKLSYCIKHEMYWVSDCPECMAESIEQCLLIAIRDKWAYELAAGHPVMALKLEDWVKLCKDKGINNQDWWELKEA